eukprot:scaffold144883_cov29-Tisochrysis_lutea.AAC.4
MGTRRDIRDEVATKHSRENPKTDDLPLPGTWEGPWAQKTKTDKRQKTLRNPESKTNDDDEQTPPSRRVARDWHRRLGGS